MPVDLLGTTRGVFRLSEIRRQATPDQSAPHTGIIGVTISEPDDATATVVCILENRPHIGAEQDVNWPVFEQGGAVSRSIEVTTRILFDAARFRAIHDHDTPSPIGGVSGRKRNDLDPVLVGDISWNSSQVISS